MPAEIRHGTIVLMLFALAMIGVASCGARKPPSRFGELPPVEAQDNLALGHPYTTSAWPNYRAYKGKKNSPDYATALTDGRFAERDSRYKTFIFGSSPTALIFSGTSEVEIIVDLGRVQPIGAVWVRHDATTGGSFLPRGERYYVSEDGEHFFLVGEFHNDVDPVARRLSKRDVRSSYFKGVELFGSGPLRAKGRYLLVRTQASGVVGGKANPTYIGYDEIVVERGRFSIAAAAPVSGPAYVPSRNSLEADVLGWRHAPPTWFDMFADGPLVLGLNPHYFYGDDAYHLSVDGVYVLSFRGLTSRATTLSDVELEITLPAAVEVISHRSRWELSKPEKLVRDGKPYHRYQMRFLGPKPQKMDQASMGFLVVTPAGQTVGPLGRGSYRYRYRADNQPYQAAEKSFEIVAHERITASVPKRMTTSVWFMKMMRAFSDHENTVRRYLQFYREAGFNTLRSLPDADVAKWAKELGITNVGITAIARNGYGFDRQGGRKWREEPGALFQFHPKFARSQKNQAMCPTVMASPATRPKLEAVARRLLDRVDHLRVNFEPYMYQKRGCICSLCRESYREFAGLSHAEVEAQWPDVVVARNSTHARFSSWQLGRAVKAVQSAVRRAGESMGKPRADLIIAASYRDFDPDDSAHAIKDPAEYLDGIDQLVTWNFPYSVDGGSFDRLRLVGSNLAAIPRYEMALEMVRAEQKRRGTPHVPAVTNSCGIFYPGEFRLGFPRDFYFSAVLTFLLGFEGHTSYTEAGVDARYMALRARANEIMATYEDLVWDGRAFSDFRVEPYTRLPALRARIGRLEQLEIFFSKGYRKGKEQLVALGNDYIEPTFVTLRVLAADGDTIHLLDRVHRTIVTGTSGISSQALREQGVVVALDAKDFALLEVRRDLAGVDLARYRVIDPAATRAAADAAAPRLAALAAELEAADARTNRD